MGDIRDDDTPTEPAQEQPPLPTETVDYSQHQEVEPARQTSLAKRAQQTAGSALARYLEENGRPRLQSLLASESQADRFLALARLAAYRQPELNDCDPASILGVVLDAARLGLPIGARGMWPTVRGGKGGRKQAVGILDYRAIIDLARTAGYEITADLIHERDTYTVRLGTDPRVDHDPLLTGDRGEPIAAYAIARRVGCPPIVRLVTLDEIDRAQKAGGPSWRTDWAPMARKTAIRRLAPYLPLSPEVSMALADDERRERGEVTP